MRANNAYLMMFFLFMLLQGVTGVCQAGTNSMRKGPFFQKKQTAKHVVYETSVVKFVWNGLIGFYSNVISPADGARSPSYPTGSAYGRQVIQTHGFFLGVILTADRLLHESGKPLGPTLKIFGKHRYYDPPENNTFWWNTPG